MWEAFGRRLRRNYLWIYLILGISWCGKNFLFPAPVTSLSEFMQRAAVGSIPGYFMIGMGAVYHLFLLLIAVGTVGMTKATGEILPRFGVDQEGTEQPIKNSNDKRSWFSSRHRRKQYLALIITDKKESVSGRILADMHRGVTALQGKGMYTGKEHSVLICAVTMTEVHNLKSAVGREDPKAFVIVSPAQEILGHGFNPLMEE